LAWFTDRLLAVALDLPAGEYVSFWSYGIATETTNSLSVTDIAGIIVFASLAGTLLQVG